MKGYPSSSTRPHSWMVEVEEEEELSELQFPSSRQPPWKAEVDGPTSGNSATSDITSFFTAFRKSREGLL